MTHSEKMRENYEDAVFFLLMDQLANEQGKYYQEINEQLKNDPTFKVPCEVSQACYRTIHQEFSKINQTEIKRVAGKSISACCDFNCNVDTADYRSTGYFT